MPALTRILCPIDFSETSRRAVECAMSLARWHEARLSILHVFASMPVADAVAGLGAAGLPPPLHATARAEALQRLRDLIPELVRAGHTVHVEITDGRPHRDVLRPAAERHADLIVMGAHGRGAIDRFVFGSNTYAVIRDTVCPVRAVHPLRRPADR